MNRQVRSATSVANDPSETSITETPKPRIKWICAFSTLTHSHRNAQEGSPGSKWHSLVCACVLALEYAFNSFPQIVGAAAFFCRAAGLH